MRGTPSMAQTDQVGVAAVLANRNFVMLWVAQVLSQTAQNAIFYALIVAVENVTSSTLQTGVLIISIILPSILFGIAAGVYVDRWNKKAVLVFSNILRAIVVLAYIPFSRDVALIYAVNFAFSTIGQFFAPAELAAIPTLVPRKHLMAANGLFNLTLAGSQMAGFVILGPVLVKFFGLSPFFFWAAVVFGLAGVMVGFLPQMKAATKAAAAEAPASFFSSLGQELRDGWMMLRGDVAILLSLAQVTLGTTLILVIGMLAPGFATRVIGVGAEDAVFILAPAGIGVLVGMLTIPRLAQTYTKHRLVDIGLLGMAFSLVLLGIVGRSRGLLMAIMGPDNPEFLIDMVGSATFLALLLGLTYAMFNIPAQTIIQERAPAAMRGRVLATQIVLGNAVSLLPLLLLGGLADLVGVSLVIIFLGFVVLVVGIFSHYRGRKLHLTIPEIPPDQPYL